MSRADRAYESMEEMRTMLTAAEARDPEATVPPLSLMSMRPAQWRKASCLKTGVECFSLERELWSCGARRAVVWLSVIFGFQKLGGLLVNHRSTCPKLGQSSICLDHIVGVDQSHSGAFGLRDKHPIEWVRMRPLEKTRELGVLRRYA
jgi:hypothetical protein